MKPEGLAFFVAVPSTTTQGAYIYAVSNRHVVCDSASVMRVNLRAGGVEILEFQPHDWICHPAGDDVAILPVPTDHSRHEIMWIPSALAITPDSVSGENPAVMLGDEIIQVGRFIGHDGGKRNLPSVRFGHFSIPLMEARNDRGYMQESFGVEVHSISGYSGSPDLCLSTFSVFGWWDDRNSIHCSVDGDMLGKSGHRGRGCRGDCSSAASGHAPRRTAQEVCIAPHGHGVSRASLETNRATKLALL